MPLSRTHPKYKGLVSVAYLSGYQGKALRNTQTRCLWWFSMVCHSNSIRGGCEGVSHGGSELMSCFFRPLVAESFGPTWMRGRHGRLVMAAQSAKCLPRDQIQVIQQLTLTGAAHLAVPGHLVYSFGPSGRLRVGATRDSVVQHPRPVSSLPATCRVAAFCLRACQSGRRPDMTGLDRRRHRHRSSTR